MYIMGFIIINLMNIFLESCLPIFLQGFCK